MVSLSSIWKTLNGEKPQVAKQDAKLDKNNSNFNSKHVINIDKSSKIEGKSYSQIQEEVLSFLAKSTTAQAIMNCLLDDIIGRGIRLIPAPSTPYLSSSTSSSLNSSELKDFKNQARRIFDAFVNSKLSSFDNTQNLFQLQHDAYSYFLSYGEFFAIIRYQSDAIYPINIQLIPPKLVKNPSSNAQIPNGNTCKYGIEFDANGLIVAYHITDTNSKSIRVERFTIDGKIQMLHGFNKAHPSNIRGISQFAFVIDAINRYERYTRSEFTKSIVLNKPLVLIFGTKISGDVSNFLQSRQGASSLPLEGNSDYSVNFSENDFDNDGMIFQQLNKNTQDIRAFESTKTTADFIVFSTHLLQNILNFFRMPVSVFNRKHDASYSASRAETNLYIETIESSRDAFGSQFMIPIYQAFMKQELMTNINNNDEISIKIKSYFNNKDVSLRAKEMLIGSVVIGLSKRPIDPLREAKAWEVLINMGIISRTEITMMLSGEDFDDVASNLKHEDELLKELSSSTLKGGNSDTKQ